MNRDEQDKIETAPTHEIPTRETDIDGFIRAVEELLKPIRNQLSGLERKLDALARVVREHTSAHVHTLPPHARAHGPEGLLGTPLGAEGNGNEPPRGEDS